ncbi:MAG: hypothetical protein Q8N95_11770 [Desulfobacterales bacterium]|nr:hypothetical protein [Desulfobacterales bacterium]
MEITLKIIAKQTAYAGYEHFSGVFHGILYDVLRVEKKVLIVIILKRLAWNYPGSARVPGAKDLFWVNDREIDQGKDMGGHNAHAFMRFPHFADYIVFRILPVSLSP